MAASVVGTVSGIGAPKSDPTARVMSMMAPVASFVAVRTAPAPSRFSWSKKLLQRLSNFRVWWNHEREKAEEVFTDQTDQIHSS